MTAKEALILSIYKYNWSAANPTKRLPREYVVCKLCIHSSEEDRRLANNAASCETCIMYNHWPDIDSSNGVTCDSDVWVKWSTFTRETTVLDNYYSDQSYDVEFFALLLVDAFHSRLQQLYRRKP